MMCHYAAGEPGSKIVTADFRRPFADRRSRFTVAKLVPDAPPSFASLIWRSGPAARLRPNRVPLVGLGANPTLALRRFLFREDFATHGPREVA